MSEHKMIAAIKKRLEKDYVFDEAGDIVVDWHNDLWWLINEHAALKRENEALWKFIGLLNESYHFTLQASKGSIIANTYALLTEEEIVNGALM